MNAYIRKTLIIAVFFTLWEVVSRFVNNPLLLPTFSSTAMALVNAVTSSDNSLLDYVFETSKALFSGFAIGTTVAALLTMLAVNTKIGEEILSTVTGAFAPLPAVAIFPLSLMFFGISFASQLFIAAFATVFPVAISMTQGFKAVSPTLRNVGRNLGMSGFELALKVLFLAALPSILSGLRSGFSNGFRALVAVEMVMGAASGKGGLGWFVMSSKQNLDIPEVYAGIFAIMAVGLLFEASFRVLETHTIKRWGMSI